jgi:Asp-tRNA(Asn)/Glu-tRNA(Gln) amidotransferase B subunit
VKEGWEAVIGLEAHAQFKTDSNIFRRAAPEFIRSDIEAENNS